LKSKVDEAKFPDEAAYSVPIPEPGPLSYHNPEALMRTIAFKIVKLSISNYQMMHLLFQFPILNH
jgi:hypothetical protein